MTKLLLILIVLLCPSIVFAQGFGTLYPNGVKGQNGSTQLGRAITVRCDNNCIICTMSGTTMSISLSPSCTGGGGSSFMLLEDSSFILLEDGTKLIL